MNPDAALAVAGPLCRTVKRRIRPSSPPQLLIQSLVLHVVSSAAALQAGQRDPGRGGRIRHHPASGKVAQLHLAHLHPSPHPHLPGRVGRPLTADHHHSGRTGGALHLLRDRFIVCFERCCCHMPHVWMLPSGRGPQWENKTTHTLHHYVSALLIKG